ncbi:MAG: hypothetical protein L6Q80_14820, partial [Dehalococcoidia bacterium]|nr:hypothetical protein [Dehalococcoidia bacterium]
HPFGYARSYPIGANDPTGLWPVDGDIATSDCQSGNCTSYGPLYDYGYPDVEHEWGDTSLQASKVVDAILSAVEDGVAWWGTNIEEPNLQAAMASGELVGQCAADVVCSSTVSATLHALGAQRPFGLFFEELAQIWDDLSIALQDLPGYYPRPRDGETVPASIGLVGEANCP